MYLISYNVIRVSKEAEEIGKDLPIRRCILAENEKKGVVGSVEFGSMEICASQVRFREGRRAKRRVPRVPRKKMDFWHKDVGNGAEPFERSRNVKRGIRSASEAKLKSGWPGCPDAKSGRSIQASQSPRSRIQRD